MQLHINKGRIYININIGIRHVFCCATFITYYLKYGFLAKGWQPKIGCTLHFNRMPTRGGNWLKVYVGNGKHIHIYPGLQYCNWYCTRY